MNRFSEARLLLIVVFLAVISLRSFLAPQSAEAAQHSKYMVATARREIGKPCQDCSAQGVLDKYSTDGCEFITVTTNSEFIFRK